MKKSLQNGTMPAGVYFVSLGCPKNLVDTEVMAGTLLSAGYRLVDDPETAKIYLINTCAFLPAAREEAFQALRDAAAWKKSVPDGKIVVAGCLTTFDKTGELRKAYPMADLWVSPDDAAQLPAIFGGKRQPTPGSQRCSWIYDETTPRLLLTLPHVAYLKIAEGCSNCCTFCAIPNLRGALRSRTVASVRREAENLIAGGAKEIVLIAQDVTAFGLDVPERGETLTKLLKELNALEGDFVLRLLYTYPAHFTEELIDFLASRPAHVLPYLDIPLQHASDRILRAMGRRITAAETAALLRKLRDRIPDLTLRTTFITGFPGETEEEFKELLSFLKEFKFERCGVFAYAAEPGTPAAKLPDQIPGAVAEARLKKLMRTQKSIMKKANAAWVDREIDLLIDDVDGLTAVGRGMMDAPEIDNAVVVKSRRKLRIGEFYRVRITGADAYWMNAELVKK